MSDQGDRSNKGKPRVSLMLLEGMIGVGEVSAFGERKYATHNWLKGLKATEVVDSLVRHLVDWLAGEDLDPESRLHHLDHIAWNALALATLRRRNKLIDDRAPKPVSVGGVIVTPPVPFCGVCKATEHLIITASGNVYCPPCLAVQRTLVTEANKEEPK